MDDQVEDLPLPGMADSQLQAAGCVKPTPTIRDMMLGREPAPPPPALQGGNTGQDCLSHLDAPVQGEDAVAALSRLTDREREVMELRAEGLSHAGVAAVLHVSRARAAELWKVARDKMCRALRSRDK